MFDRIDRDQKNQPVGIRGFFYWWLESEQNEKRYVIDLFISSVIILSIVIIILDISYGPASRTPDWVTRINTICLVIFIVEYLLRFWVNTDFAADWREDGFRTALKNKILWMVRPYSLIDLFAIIPVGALRSLRVFRFFRIARLLRVLKLGRYSSGLSGFFSEIKNRSYELLALSGIVCAVILIGATAIYTVESPHNEGSLINNFGDALWWAIVTTTTVGYGDIYPKHFEGRLIATALMLTSIGIVGALGGILTTAMMERIRKMREGRIERITFSNHIVFCGWTSCAEKVADSLERVDLLDEKKLVIVNEHEVPDKDYLVALEEDFTRPASLKTVNAGDAEYVVIFYQTGENTSHRTADRKSVLTALQAENLNPGNTDPYTITEVFDRRSTRLILGEDIQGDETLDKEEFDANLILNTIQYPGHTTRMFYNLSDFHDQWIQLKDLSTLLSPGDSPITAGELREQLVDNSERRLFLGVLEESDSRPVLNPPNEYRLTESSRVYVVEKSPYPKEKETEYRGIRAVDRSLRNQLHELEQDIVFLGFNRCAKKLLDKFERSPWVKSNQEIVVISTNSPPEKQWIRHLQTDYAEAEKIRDEDWWEDKQLAVIFHESTAGTKQTPHNIDIRNAVTSLVLPEDVRVIAEIIDEDYDRVLQHDIERDIELIYKERFDANLIASSILNDGEISELFRTLGSLSGNRLRTYYLDDLLPDTSEISVRKLRERLLEHDRLTFLGVMKTDSFEPILNPEHNLTIGERDFLYCISDRRSENEQRET